MLELFESARARLRTVWCAAFCYILRKQHNRTLLKWKINIASTRNSARQRAKNSENWMRARFLSARARKRLVRKKTKIFIYAREKTKKSVRIYVCRAVGRSTCATSCEEKSSIVLYGHLCAAAAALPPVLFGLLFFWLLHIQKNNSFQHYIII